MRAKAPILRSFNASHTILLGNDPNKRSDNSLVFYFLRMVELKNIFAFYNEGMFDIITDDYNDWDYIIAMDDENLYDINDVIGTDPKKKVRLLMSFTGKNSSVSDPWYTRDFARAYNDIYQGCEALLTQCIS